MPRPRGSSASQDERTDVPGSRARKPLCASRRWYGTHPDKAGARRDIQGIYHLNSDDRVLPEGRLNHLQAGVRAGFTRQRPGAGRRVQLGSLGSNMQSAARTRAVGSAPTTNPAWQHACSRRLSARQYARRQPRWNHRLCASMVSNAGEPRPMWVCAPPRAQFAASRAPQQRGACKVRDARRGMRAELINTRAPPPSTRPPTASHPRCQVSALQPALAPALVAAGFSACPAQRNPKHGRGAEPCGGMRPYTRRRSSRARPLAQAPSPQRVLRRPACGARTACSRPLLAAPMAALRLQDGALAARGWHRTLHLCSLPTTQTPTSSTSSPPPSCR